MSGHTPGPWQVFDEGYGAFPGIEGDNGTVTVIIFGVISDDDGGVRGRNREEIAANARLIAAAPDLFDAVAEYLDYAAPPQDQTGEPVLLGIRARLRAALAKAKGEP